MSNGKKQINKPLLSLILYGLLGASVAASLAFSVSFSFSAASFFLRSWLLEISDFFSFVEKSASYGQASFSLALRSKT